MRRTKKGLGTLAVIITLMFISSGGCKKDENNPADAASGDNYSTFVKCYNCHSDEKNPEKFAKIFGDSLESKSARIGWLNGPHANNESYEDKNGKIDRGIDNQGYPSYQLLADEKNCSAECHDPLGDGRLLAAAGIQVLGRTNRPIVMCESCHGGGGGHNPGGFNKPDAARCGQCHTEKIPADSHLSKFPEGIGIYEKYLVSPHSRSINENNYTDSSKTFVKAVCSRCHTDEGMRANAISLNGTATYEEINVFMSKKPDLANASNVTCRTCHNPHNPAKYTGSLITDLPSIWSDEFKTCTTCHQLFTADGAVMTQGYHDPAVNSIGNVDHIITDTHYDNPETNEIEGYVLNPTANHNPLPGNTNNGACPDCHNPHDNDATKNKQWSRSAHGGYIAIAKEKGPKEGTTSILAPAYVSYDFKSEDRRSCQRCHTATGFRNFANDPVNYDPAKISNSFVAQGKQREMLYCWACHTSTNGDLRNPGIFSKTAPYPEPRSDNLKIRIAAVPDIKGSNICISCHSGRETGQHIKDKNFEFDIDKKNFGPFSSHFLVAGGILFRTAGYEYDGKNYEKPVYFMHDKIGTPEGNNTGSNGPCVGCHMSSSEGHTFLPVRRVEKEDGSVEISEVLTNEKICSKCHTGAQERTPELLNNLNRQYAAALEALQKQLEAKGIYYNKTKFPYFFTTGITAEQDPFNTAFINWADKDTLGAAFNLNLLVRMPGGEIHNPEYVKRLIYDSIDFIDNGILDLSTQATLETSGLTTAAKFIGTRP